ncbi:hypothetical protein QBC33DRAFT_594993 [Phialemonium atrogriseum]|uniref:Uncharacterized protein n=1 Tax=Phialemonium atrogriseum TaxID=1093897 RepID=A0AAJ0BWL0_9PEZI|nr:uncharacterized protein QBC33DRAFT_594993 [Phialemonium atrogriseum]KAK1764392.1 hypothetical protein QBC33DRAFT_594993 [Phialemonium atrogriseum]
MSTPKSDSFVQQDISTSDLDDDLTEVDSLVLESPEQHKLPTCPHRDILQGEKPDILLVRESIQAILQNVALFITVTVVTFRLILVILRHLASPQRAERIPLLRRLATTGGSCAGNQAIPSRPRESRLRDVNLQGRPRISRPIGPVLHNGVPMIQTVPQPSIAVSHMTAYPSYSVNGAEHDENVPPGSGKSTPKPRLPKSRTLNMLSSLTQSFSRSSVGSIASNRNLSTGSSSTITTDPLSTHPRIAQPFTSLQNREPTEPAKKLEAKSEHPPPHPDPRLIYTAQPSSYWAGRFTAIHDRLRGELLKPHNLAVVLEAHIEEHTMMLAHASAATNPSASAYAPSMVRRPRRNSSSAPDSPNPRIPVSSTSGAVLQTVTAVADMSRRPGPQQQQQRTADAAMLADDDMRRRRALLKLEGLCATAEARASLRAWQLRLARLEGRTSLLPRGAMMGGGGGGGPGREVSAAGSRASGLVGRLLLFGGRRSPGPTVGAGG